MKESSILKIVLRANKKTAHKKRVVIQDTKNTVCRYVSTYDGIFRVMSCYLDPSKYLVEPVMCVGY